MTVHQQHQQTFLSSVLPRVEAHGRVFFRHVRCKHAREELVAEMVGLCWRSFLRLVRRGKDVLQFVSTLASYAARAVSNGRRLCGQDWAKDPMTRSTQRNRGFTVGSLAEFGSVADALHENSFSPVLDQVAFRLDFPRWKRTRSARDRKILETMMLGEGTAVLAKTFGVSPARISQLRQEFHDDWNLFCDESTPQAA